MRKHGRAAVLIGEAAPKIRAALAPVVPVELAKDMDEAVELAASLPNAETRWCCRRPAPASTCFATTPTAPRSTDRGAGRSSAARRTRSPSIRRSTDDLRERIARLVAGAQARSACRDGEPPPATEGPDLWLVAAVLALTGFGIVMVFSAGAVFAAKTYGDWTYFLKREAIYAGVGLLAFFVGSRLDYSVYRKITYPLLFLSMALLAAVLKLGPSINGAVRWFRLGPLSFQPSELAKFALALYLAVLLARKAEKVRDFSMGFLPPLLMTGVFLGLLLKQPDLGTAVIIGVTALGLMFVAGTRTSYILISVLIAAPIGWKVFITGESWRMKRLLAFLYPWQYRRNTGYQLYESLISVGSGGVWGQGLGQGHQKLFFLPEAHTDFILAVVGEELGLVGVLCRARCAFRCWCGAGCAPPCARATPTVATWPSASPVFSGCKPSSTCAWCWASCRPRDCPCPSSATAARRWS
jgi:cell division protein FtsW